MGSETLPSACYILSDESSILFYSTSNGYKNRYDAISLNINNWETLLINLKNCKIYYENYLIAINE